MAAFLFLFRNFQGNSGKRFLALQPDAHEDTCGIVITVWEAAGTLLIAGATRQAQRAVEPPCHTRFAIHGEVMAAAHIVSP